jgi:carbohydrate-selective porin OprB
MDFDTGRRRFLELAGTGTALSLAGCSALQNDAASQTTAETGTETASASGSERREVTVALRADQEELQQRQQEISSELRAGNITRTEAQQQYQAAQQELLSGAVTSFTERVESNDALTVVDRIDQFGVFLIEGPAAGLLDTLSFGAVNALLSAATFQQAKQQAQQQQQQQQAQQVQETNTTSTATSTSTSTPSN